MEVVSLEKWMIQLALLLLKLKLTSLLLIRGVFKKV